MRSDADCRVWGNLGKCARISRAMLDPLPSTILDEICAVSKDDGVNLMVIAFPDAGS